MVSLCFHKGLGPDPLSYLSYIGLCCNLFCNCNGSLPIMSYLLVVGLSVLEVAFLPLPSNPSVLAAAVLLPSIPEFGDIPVDNDKLQLLPLKIRQAGLKLKPAKCQFLKQRVTFLGHVVSSQGIETDPEKTKAVVDWPVPVDVKELQRFLGLVGYYRRFVT
ncbi:hypothetical protein QZH41_001388 [Actinostola sp. cb2023]|nr:hypothetical protein QZH41_001388 [Actinostola sp. cb2023]